ncbi:MAG: type II secretion system minor pseudopilin GspJ [Moraxellaceae bacterium]
MRAERRSLGFTLLELLVAVTILAFIAVGAYRLLADTVVAREQGQQHLAQMQALQKAMNLLQRDLQQVLLRPVRDEFGDVQPAFYLPQPNVMEFTRAGWRNPLGQTRSELVRLRYRLDNGELVRERWDMLDRVRTAQPERIALLQGVSDFRLRVYAANDWHGEWPLLTARRSEGQDVPLPEGVEIVFRHPVFGEMRRVIVLPENVEAPGAQTP